MPAITDLDPTRTVQLAEACVQTYRTLAQREAFLNDPLSVVEPPVGTTYEGYWEGLDIFDREHAAKVPFGLVFSVDAQPGVYYFAFRGTVGIHEWIDDAKVSHRCFRPAAPENGPPLPDDACSEEGFEQIYRSMQEALFTLVDRFQPAEVVITGHSLGSALCELFQLDLAISRPTQAMSAIDFAAPRGGSRALASFVDRQLADQQRELVRVVNIKDLVPRVPPRALGFAHAGTRALVCFEESGGILPDYGLRHSMANYLRALRHTFDLEDPHHDSDDAAASALLSFCEPGVSSTDRTR